MVPCCAGPGPALSYKSMCEKLMQPFVGRTDLIVDLRFDTDMASDKNGVISMIVA